MKPECPELVTYRIGDELSDSCGISGCHCLIENGDCCDTYNEWLLEEMDNLVEDALAFRGKLESIFNSIKH